MRYGSIPSIVIGLFICVTLSYAREEHSIGYVIEMSQYLVILHR